MIILAAVGIIAALAGGAVSMYGQREQIKGTQLQEQADLLQSMEDENVMKYNANVEFQKARTEADAIEFNNELVMDQNRKRYSEVNLRLQNSGVELMGSPLLNLTTMVEEVGGDYAENQRQADMVRTEGRTNKALMLRGAKIEELSRTNIKAGYASLIKGQQVKMAGTAVSTVGSAASSISSTGASGGSLLGNMNSSY